MRDHCRGHAEKPHEILVGDLQMRSVTLDLMGRLPNGLFDDAERSARTPAGAAPRPARASPIRRWLDGAITNSPSVDANAQTDRI